MGVFSSRAQKRRGAERVHRGTRRRAAARPGPMESEASQSTSIPRRAPDRTPIPAAFISSPNGESATELDPSLFEAKSPPGLVRREVIYRCGLALADLTAACLALAMSIAVIGDDAVGSSALLAVPMVVLLGQIVGLYDRDDHLMRKGTLDEAPAVFQLATLYALVVWMLDSVFVDGYLGNKQVLGLWLILFVFGLTSRAAARTFVRAVVGPERCVAIGDPIEARRLRTSLENSSADARIVGVLSLQEDSSSADRRDTRRFPPQAMVLPTEPAEVRETLRLLGAHRVIVVARHADSEQVLDLICLVKSLGFHVSVLPRVLEVVGSAVEFDEIEGVTVLGVRRFGLTPPARALKRAFDLLGATLGIILFLPIFAVIAMLIAIDSRGPVLFQQTRVGHKGQRFRMIKFRTMANGADASRSELAHLNEAEGIFKISNDPRVTRVGRPLRRLSIDELPQLINVIQGQMSLVGPRPLPEDEDARVHGWHRRRLELMPGMTGHWQVLGSARIPLREMVKIDYLYVANWSLWQDVKILLRTVSHVVRRRGQ